MVFEKIQSDLFRHWILGLGAGDIRIITTGARREEVLLSNILFVSRRLAIMQQLVSRLLRNELLHVRVRRTKLKTPATKNGTRP